MSLGVAIGIAGMLGIGVVLVMAPAGLDAYFNRHPWLLPAVAFLLMLVVVVEVRGYSNRLHDDQAAACERGNAAAVAELANLRNDRRNLRADRRLVSTLVAPGPVRDNFLADKTLAISRKSEAIGGKIASRAQYAIRDGSVVIDCDAAYSG